MIITRGYGEGQLIILRGFGVSAEPVTIPVVLPPDYLHTLKDDREINLRDELLSFLTDSRGSEIDLRQELLIELTIEDIADIDLRKELTEFFIMKTEQLEVDLRLELKDFYENAVAFEINLREELTELMDRERFEIDLRKELQELLT